MKLMLSISRCPSGSNMEGQQYQFGPEGGTFGRSADNTWVLPDISRHVSSIHARVSTDNSQFILNDQSTNGLFVNGSSQALGPNNPIILKSGDQIIFGDYCLNVTVIEDSIPSRVADIDPAATQLSTPAPDAVYVDDLDKWLEPVSPEPESLSSPQVKFDAHSIPKADSLSDIDLGLNPQETDPLALLGGSNVSSQPLGSADGSLSDLVGNSSPLDQQMMKVPNVIPNDWDDLLGDGASNSNLSDQKDVQLIASNTDSSSKDSESSTKQQLVSNLTATTKRQSLDDTLNPVLKSAAPPEEYLKSPADLGLSELLSTPSEQLQNVSTGSEASRIESSKELGSQQAQNFPAGDPLIEDRLDMTGSASSHKTNDTPLTEAYSDLQEPHGKETEVKYTELPQTNIANSSTETSAPTSSVGIDTINLAKELGLERLSEQQRSVLEKTVADTVKETISGMMRTLRARSEIKSEFRMNMTTIQSAENNPLKFSVTPEDAIENMFAKQGKAYLSPVDAINDGFSDIADHQVALFDAMKAAYEHILGQFDPEFLAKKFERTAGKRFLGGKVKNWEAYSFLYSEYKEDNDKTFKRLFGEVFADAYERRMHALKMSRGDSSHK